MRSASASSTRVLMPSSSLESSTCKRPHRVAVRGQDLRHVGEIVFSGLRIGLDFAQVFPQKLRVGSSRCRS